MLKRSITAIFIVAAVVGSFLLRQFVDVRLFDILIFAFCAFGSFELLRALNGRLTVFQKAVVFAFALSVTPVYTFLSISAVFAITVAAVILLFSSLVFEFETTDFTAVGTSLFALCYPSGFLLPLMIINSYEDPKGFVGLLMIIVVSTCADTAAYLVGSTVKGPKLCEKISPKKTISGAIGGVLGGIIGALGVYFLFGKGVFINSPLEWIVYVLTGGISSLVTEFGDLVEGAIKRKLDIKDLGNLLPGHGGMLDRIDGMIFNCVFMFAVFTLVSKF